MTEFSPGNSYKQASFNTISNNEISLGRTDRTLPRQVSTGNMRGTQTIGGDGVIIDSSNERIGVGKIAGTEKYQVQLTKDGLIISDATIIFISLTKDGLLMNDGVNDRVLIGKDVGGF